ncbi:MAG TPA: hypothetical protein DDW52_27025 [Planctomycetaceae bacterium]|nr:hypothetical protein [Planctomycetaceae bacterium]
MKLLPRYSLRLILILTALAAIPSVIAHKRLEQQRVRNQQFTKQWQVIDELKADASFGFDHYQTKVDSYEIITNRVRFKSPPKLGEKTFPSEATEMSVDLEVRPDALELAAKLPFLDAIVLEGGYNVSEEQCELLGQCERLRYVVIWGSCDLEGLEKILEAPKLQLVHANVKQGDLEAARQLGKSKGVCMKLSAATPAELLRKPTDKEQQQWQSVL